ncbi:glucan endo-1,3-beta-glucosidase 12-like [Aristolochia californica]|uniref:glucan endo-1,3-beta-glucosidase 12-like n=1 Tax=Aristolochia californica TaxID=171875 RepID=UPI0035D5787C
MLPLSAILLAISVLLLAAGDVSSVGINYGTLGDNLPPPKKVAQMLQSTLIDKVKIYDTDPDILDAFANTGIDLVVAVENDRVANLSRNFDAADHWLTSRLSPFLPATSVVAVAVGNEFLTNTDGATSSMDASALVPAMRNLHQALVIRGLDRKIKVSTPLSMGVLASSFPPSSSTFLDELRPVMTELVEFLIDTGAPFMINAYPYFAYRDNPSKIDLEYALLGNATGVHDPKGYVYTNMLDAQIDAVRSAIKSLGAGNRTVGITVSESGWPSRGDVAATSEKAKMYNSRLIARGDAHVGTPMAPREKVDVFVFSLFNENQKEGEASERSFGLFNADGTKAYELDLSCSFCSQEKLSFGEKPDGGARGPSVWCVAKPHADERILQAVLDFSCGPGGVDCRDLREKGACSEPNKLNAHASFAMNAYYQMHGRNYWNCDFKGIGLVTFSDPSYGSCRYSQQ